MLLLRWRFGVILVGIVVGVMVVSFYLLDCLVALLFLLLMVHQHLRC